MGTSSLVRAYSAYASGEMSPTWRLPACAWRHESLPGWSISKPLCPWCLTEPTRTPRWERREMTFSTNVVLPEF